MLGVCIRTHKVPSGSTSTVLPPSPKTTMGLFARMALCVPLHREGLGFSVQCSGGGGESRKKYCQYCYQLLLLITTVSHGVPSMRHCARLGRTIAEVIPASDQNVGCRSRPRAARYTPNTFMPMQLSPPTPPPPLAPCSPVVGGSPV